MLNKISFFLPDLRGGGAERVLVTLANQFASRAQVELVLIRKTGPLLDECSPALHIVDLEAGDEYQSLMPLTQYLRSHQPDVLLSTLSLSSIMAIVAVRMAGGDTKNIIRLASTTSLEKRSKSKKMIEKALIRWLFPQAQALIAVSKGVAQDFAHYTGIPESRVHVIYNPVYSQAVLTQSEAPLDHPWFTIHDLPVLLAVGRLEQSKNYPLLVQAFAALQKELPSRLLILGEGGAREEIESLVNSLDLRDRIDLPGFVSNPYAYMKQADCFVLSSDYEGLPNALIQAMACGCPVISTDCPSGPREILKEGEYGHLTPVGDANSLTDAIIKCLSGDQRKPPKTWLEQFEVEFVAEQYWQAIQNA
jgi:glycosyltransferase involved in cell wall biosynthesis